MNYGNVGMGAGKFTRLIRWDGKSSFEIFELVDSRGKPLHIAQGVHQIAATRDFIVVMDTAVQIEPEQLLYEDYSRGTQPVTRVHLVRRADLGHNRKVGVVSAEFPRETIHFACDYENPNGAVVLHLAHVNGADASEWVRSDDLLADGFSYPRKEITGMLPSPTDLGAVAKVTLDGNTGQLLREPELAWDEQVGWGIALTTHAPGGMNGELPIPTPGKIEAIYWNSLGYHPEMLTRRMLRLYADHPYRRVPVDQLPRQPQPAALFRVDTETMEVCDRYLFPSGTMNSSPQFVPTGTGATQGYLVCTVINDASDELWIFDASRLSPGPICRLGHRALDLGFTLHSTWLPSLRAPQSHYRVSLRRDLEDRIPFGLGRVFEQEVFSRFR